MLRSECVASQPGLLGYKHLELAKHWHYPMRQDDEQKEDSWRQGPREVD